MQNTCEDLTYIIPSLTKHSNTLIKLYIKELEAPLSFIAKFTNLQEIVFSYYYDDSFEDFKELQYVIFPQLQILKFTRACPRYELLIKFLENNGKNLKEFYVKKGNDLLNLAVAKFCPNLINYLLYLQEMNKIIESE